MEDYSGVDAQIGKAICNTCPVFDWCRKKNAKQGFGIFFATIPIERGMIDGRRTRKITHR